MLVQPPVVVHHEAPPAVIHRDDEPELARLRGVIRDLEDELNLLKAELARKPIVEYKEIKPPVLAAPEVRTEVVYEKDPFLIEQNARLSKELEEALVR